MRNVNVTTFLARRVIYPVYQLGTGRRILPKLRDLESSQWLSHTEIKQLQKERLHRLLAHAYHNVPFYRRRVEALGCSIGELVEPQVFRKLPFLTKDDILSHRNELIAANYSISDLKPNATGGSTGHRLSFYNSQENLDYHSAITIRGDRWAGLDIGTPHARLWGAPMEINAQERIVNRLGNLALNRFWLNCLRLSRSILVDYVRTLRRRHPDVLVGYATALATLARFVKARRIDDIKFKSVVSSVETLFANQRGEIEEAFDCKVYNRYGCREAGPLIAECEEGRLHINADYAYVEILRDGQPVAPGEMGEIVITPFHSYGMPFIRYRVGDLAVAAEQVPCACGRGLPAVERIVGRTSDIVVTPEGELFHPGYFNYLFRTTRGLRQFQVVQTRADRLVVKLVTDPDFKATTLTALQEKIHQDMGTLDIQWETMDEIPPHPSGKHRFIISDLRADFAGPEDSGG